MRPVRNISFQWVIRDREGDPGKRNLQPSCRVISRLVIVTELLESVSRVLDSVLHKGSFMQVTTSRLSKV